MRFPIAAAIFIVDTDLAGFHGEPAAIGHGVARIHHEIDNHLFELRGIDFYAFQVRGKGDHLRFKGLLAAERQERASERSTALDRLCEGRHAGEKFGVVMHLLDQHFGAGDDED
jgi:hypothetical protein